MVSYLASPEPARAGGPTPNRMTRLLALIALTAQVCVADMQPPDLYVGEVPVTGKDPGARQEAVPSALIHVLQKLSGRRDLQASAELDAVLAGAERLLLAYAYELREQPMPDGEALSETWLVARFLPEAVDRAMMRLGLPRWRKDRPAPAIWVVLDDGDSRRLMPVEYDYAWASLRWIARHRGLPLVWPELPEAGAPGGGVDAETPEGPDLGVLWGGFTEQLPPLEGAAGGVVVVAARRVGADWDVRWVYDDGTETATWRTAGRALPRALAEGMHRLIDRVAERDSIGGGMTGAWERTLTVAGLGTAGDYARCLSYLERLPVVDTLTVLSARPGEATFGLVLNAEPRYLEQLLQRDRVLESGARPGDWLLAGARAGTATEP